jgi:hypothetical protein
MTIDTNTNIFIVPSILSENIIIAALIPLFFIHVFVVTIHHLKNKGIKGDNSKAFRVRIMKLPGKDLWG